MQLRGGGGDILADPRPINAFCNRVLEKIEDFSKGGLASEKNGSYNAPTSLNKR